MTKRRTSRSKTRRTSRRVRSNAPPPLYRAVGIDVAGHKVAIGSGPLSRMRETALATWMGDAGLRSAYVVDPKGHSYLSLEPRDRTRLMANRHNDHLDGLEHELEHEMTQAWGALNSGDTWRAQDAYAHVEALSDFATDAQRTEIRSLRDAMRHAQVTPWHSGAMDRNAARLGGTKELAIEAAIALVRDVRPPDAKSFIPLSAYNRIKLMGPGLYKYGSGTKREHVITKFKADLAGALISTRIGASKSNETHWLVDNHSGYPVVVRIIDDHGRSVFRVEEYAKSLQRELVAVGRTRSRVSSAR